MTALIADDRSGDLQIFDRLKQSPEGHSNPGRPDSETLIRKQSGLEAIGIPLPSLLISSPTLSNL